MKRRLIIFCLCAVFFASHAHARTLFVDGAASRSGDGSSWSSAYRYIEDALSAARSGDDIWVAKGTYTPTGGSNRSATFQLKEGVGLYGGFIGTERRFDQRDYRRNQTILSGDIGRSGYKEDNVYTVVTGANDAILDGFTITGGYSLNARPTPQAGRGRHQRGQGRQPGSRAGTGGATHTTPDAVMSNKGPGMGAGLLNFQASPTVRNCVFQDNHAGKGGAVYNMTSTTARSRFESSKTPTFINCIFWNNSARGRGGAVANDLRTSPTFLNCVFDSNHCDVKGGAIYNDFGCSPIVINSLFHANTARNGAALGNDGSSNPVLYYTTFTKNIAEDSGPALYQGSGSSNTPSAIKSIFWANQCDFEDDNFYNWQNSSLRIENSVIQGGYPGKGNTDVNPGLKRDFMTNGDYGYKGDDPQFTEADLSQLVRTALGYRAERERPRRSSQKQSTPLNSGRVIYVNYDLASWGNGKSWDSAYARLDDALKDAARDGAEIWIAKGTYTPEGAGRDATFKLSSGVKLYGGFKGNESRRDQRDWQRNTTILSGDIGKKGFSEDNCYHVLTGANGVTLDGLTITGGHADGSVFDSRGGGLVNYPDIQGAIGLIEGYSATIENCRFIGNYADEGGAVFTFGTGTTDFDNCEFSGNSARNGGAVLDRVGTKSSFTNCRFLNNTATWRGGALYFDYGARPTIEESRFENNMTNGHGGAIFAVSRASQLENTGVTIRDSRFTNNSAKGDGGGIHFHDQTLAIIEESNFSGNQAGRNGDDMAVTDGSKINQIGNRMATSAYMGEKAMSFNGAFPASNRQNASRTTGGTQKQSRNSDNLGQDLPPEGMQSGQRAGHPDPAMLIQRMDRNGDDCISSDEARGPIRNRIQQLDANGDGCLSADELQQPKGNRATDRSHSPKTESRLVLNTPDAAPGYTLFAPMGSNETYLLDMEGNTIKTWHTEGRSTGTVYLLDNGNLLRTTSPAPNQIQTPFNGQGTNGGIIQEISPSGNVVWEYSYVSDTVRQHHDIEPLPNGNILVLAWELKTTEDIRAAGGDPSAHPDGEIWAEHIVELEKTGPRSGDIVWEWHTWDHLVQDYDRAAPDYANPTVNPQRVNLNYNPSRKPDWQHANSIDYNPHTDQIVISLRSFNEIWIIDHSTTTAQAASDTGGRMERGGNILFRYGNPNAYSGTGSQTFFGQHDARWIPEGYPGVGNIMIFNNGSRQSRRSDVVEIMPDNYRNSTGLKAEIAWSYRENGGETFYADHISGAHRLENGNTLICAGTTGTLFEVDESADTVWEYQYGTKTSTSLQTRGRGQSRDRRNPGQGQNNHIFRATRIPLDAPGLNPLLSI